MNNTLEESEWTATLYYRLCIECIQVLTTWLKTRFIHGLW